VRRWITYSVGFLVGGPPLLFVLAVGGPVPVVVAVAGIAGLATGGINPILGAVQFERIPEAMLPRVLGAVKAVAWSGLPLGPLVAGALTEAVGVRTALLTFGGLYLVVAAAPFVLPSFRLMDERPPGPAGRTEPDAGVAAGKRAGAAQ
jgi:MFS family permease